MDIRNRTNTRTEMVDIINRTYTRTEIVDIRNRTNTRTEIVDIRNRSILALKQWILEIGLILELK